MEQRLTVEEICNKLKPVFGKKIDEIYLKYAMAESIEEREEIAHILSALYHKHLSELLNKKVLLEPPSNAVMDGEYPLAKVVYADKELFPFKLREKDWIRHVCISGMSGSGKTTIAFHIINNFLERKKPFLVFDWKKSFRPLLSVDSEILNFTVGNEKVSNLFKMNINEPPEGVAPKEWINVLCDLIVESFSASFGVHKVLLETLDEAFKEWGIYNGSNNYPTWNHIKWRLEQKIDKANSRESTWLESALRVASVLTFGSFGKVCNYKGDGSMNVEELLDKKVIFELNALSNIEKKFFCEFILTYIYKLKKANQKGIDEGFKNAIVVDEAHNIFLKDKTNFVNESVTDMVYREMREYGTSLVCLDQHISKLSDTVAGNSACHIAFQQQLPQDIQTISGIMQLMDRRQFFTMLPVGSAIVKLSERYSRPFLVNVDPVSLRKESVSDRDVANRMNLIFAAKELKEGRDNKFKQELIDPRQARIEERKAKGRKARVPKHALYNGELNEFKHIKNDFNEKFGSVLNANNEEDVSVKCRPESGMKYVESTQKFGIDPNDSECLVDEEETVMEKIEEIADTAGLETVSSYSNESEKSNHAEQSSVKTSEASNHAESKDSGDLMTYKEALADFGVTVSSETAGSRTASSSDKSDEASKIAEQNSVKEIEASKDAEQSLIKQTDEKLEKQDSINESARLNQIENNLSKCQKILFEFVQTKLEKGWNICQIEEFLEKNRTEGYCLKDISQAINCALNEKLVSFSIPKSIPLETESIPEKVVTEELEQNQKVYKLIVSNSNNINEDLSDGQKNFIDFLRENPEHELSTVNLYKKINLSPRKGNKIKDQLIQKGLIKVKEERNEKGWKKIIILK